MAIMKHTMLDMMVKMMPFMMPLVYVGGALIVIGILATIWQLIGGRGGGVAKLAAWLLVILGAFFLASQTAGMMLGATPSINFGDSTKFEFDLKPFWQVGLGLLVPGVLLALLARQRHS